jgi:hypothetical protein
MVAIKKIFDKMRRHDNPSGQWAMYVTVKAWQKEGVFTEAFFSPIPAYLFVSSIMVSFLV